MTRSARLLCPKSGNGNAAAPDWFANDGFARAQIENRGHANGAAKARGDGAEIAFIRLALARRRLAR